ncbi:ATP-binding protein [Thalassoroseus pseudoceratinae]|uniref:ATP-binding protein n=1 Tax=Thalassoroseus pseudoceratinae TaxID=2713176 RepID=UPI0014214760|nr:ATP-binding protein [Thalassoroseus pseudoceratinae]
MIASFYNWTRRFQRLARTLQTTPYTLLIPQTECVAAATTLAIFVVAIPHQASWFITAFVVSSLTVESWRLRTVAHAWHALETGKLSLQVEARYKIVSDARRQLTAQQQTKQWLNRLATAETFHQALTEVMRQLVPRAGTGFVAWLDCSSQPSQITHCRGLSPESKQRLRFDEEWLKTSIRDQFLTLQGQSLRESTLYDAMTREDRRGIEAVHFLGINSPLGRGVLMTSEMLPVENAIDVTREIIVGLQRHVANGEETGLPQSHPPQPTFLDSEFVESTTTPLDLLHDFIDELRRVTEVDRVGLLLGNVAAGGQAMSIAESSRELPPNVLTEWTQTELTICRTFGSPKRFQRLQKNGEDIVSLDANALRRIGIEVLIGQAWLVPIEFEGRHWGVVCMTSQRSRSLSDPQLRWAIGCARCIAELLHGLHTQPSIPHNKIDRHEQQFPDSSSQQSPTNAGGLEDEALVLPDELAILSHEIRNPMNGVLSMVQLALQTDLTTEQREYLDIVRVSSESLLETVNGVLEQADGTADPPTNAEVNLDQLLSEVLRTFAAKAAEKGIELIGHRPPDIGDLVNVDRRRLRQVLINLVANSVKFTAVGEVFLSVQNAKVDGHSGLRFIVRDTGIGIPADKQKQIFQPFVQAEDDTKTRFGGTGLGLAVSRELVQEMGGEISLKSQVGHGTSFEFSIPVTYSGDQVPTPVPSRGTMELRVANETLRQCLTETFRAEGWDLRIRMEQGSDWVIIDESHAIAFEPEPNATNVLRLRNPIHAPTPQSPSADIVLIKPVLSSSVANAIQTDIVGNRSKVEPEVVSSSLPKRDLKILVADDDAVNQHVNQTILKRLARHVEVVESGEATILAFNESEFDVVFLDRKMQGIDGFGTARKLRRYEQQNHRKPALVILLSGFVGPQERLAAERAGIDDCLVKPLDGSRIEAIFAAHFSTTNAEEKRPNDEPLDTPTGLTPKTTRLLQNKLTEDWPQLKDAIQDQDFSLWEDKAHSLKGAVSCVAWDSLEQRLFNLETHARQKSAELPIDILDEIEHLINAFVANPKDSTEIKKTTPTD